MPGASFEGHFLPANVDGFRSPSQAGRCLQFSTELCDTVESLVSWGFRYFFFFFFLENRKKINLRDPLEQRILWDTQWHFPSPLELLQVLGGFSYFCVVLGCCLCPPMLGGLCPWEEGAGLPSFLENAVPRARKTPELGARWKGQEQPQAPKNHKGGPCCSPHFGGIPVPHHRLLQGARGMSSASPISVA